MVVLVDSFPQSIDPLKTEDPLALAFLAPVYSQLLQIDPVTGRVTPDLAWHWETSSGGTSYTFRLRPEARFHDGTAVTAQAVVEGLRSLQSTGLGQALLGGVAALHAADDVTLVLSLEHPQASLLSYLALEAMAITSGGGPGLPSGSGPFRPRTPATGPGRWELARNPAYYLPTRPYLEGIVFWAIEDDGVRLAAFRSGRGHILGIPGGLRQEELQAVRAWPEVALTGVSALTHYAFLMNTRFPPWDDLRVRQAVNWAVDREGFARWAEPWGGRVGTLLAPGTAWSLNLPPSRQLGRARGLLAEAGYPDGIQVRMVVPSGTLNQETAFRLKDQLAEAGIEMEPLFFAADMARDMVQRIAFQSALLPLFAPAADPDYLLGRRFVTGGDENYTRYSNPAVDDLYRRQAQALGPAARRELVAQMERLIVEDSPAVSLWWESRIIAYRPQVRNIYLGPGLYGSPSFQDAWLGEG